MQRLILLPALMLAGIACTDVTSPTPFRPFLSVQASENPFVGSWENIDVDGSQEHVTISNSSSIQVHLRDDGATFSVSTPD